MAAEARHAIRRLIRCPAFTFSVTLVLSAGLSIFFVIASIGTTVLVRPLPFDNPSELVMVWRSTPSTRDGASRVSWFDFGQWHESTRSFEALAAFSPVTHITGTSTDAQRILGCRVSEDLFRALGVTAAIGRLPSRKEHRPGAPRIAVLSHKGWQRLFSGRMDVLGRTVRLTGEPHVVVGVLPQSFGFPTAEITPGWGYLSGEADVFHPFGWAAAQHPDNVYNHMLLGRLAPGVTVREAEVELNMLAARLAQFHPKTNAGWSVSVVRLHEQMTKRARPSLIAILGCSLLLLLIACFNAMGLITIRSEESRRERSIRAALGADATTLVLGPILETAFMVLMSSVTATIAATGATHLITVFFPRLVPRLNELHLEPTVVLAGIGLVGIILMLWAISRRGSDSTIGDGLRLGVAGGHEGRTFAMSGRTIIFIEVAATAMLVCVAGVLLRSYIHLQRLDPGFSPHQLLTLQLTAPAPLYANPDSVDRFYRSVMESLKSIPGVVSAGAISSPPLAGVEVKFPIQAIGSERGESQVAYSGVTPDYFMAMHIPVVAGRSFTTADDQHSRPVAVVSESFAQTFWPGANPIGRQIHVGGPDNVRTVVGVVSDVALESIESRHVAAVYHPHAQRPWRPMTVFLRTEPDPAGLIDKVRGEILRIDPEQAIYNVRTVDEVVSQSLATPRSRGVLAATFSALALLIAVFGVWGIVSYFVVRRRREIAIRMAVGASPVAILSLVVREVMLLATGATITGLGATLLAQQSLVSILGDVQVIDVYTLAAVFSVMVGASAFACLAPALRASSIDPSCALRTD